MNLANKALLSVLFFLFGMTKSLGYVNLDYSVEVPFSLSIIDTIKICGQDTAILTADSLKAEYEWNTGDTTEQIKVSRSGWYRVISFDTLSIADTSEFLVSILNPQVSQKLLTKCKDDSLSVSLLNVTDSCGMLPENLRKKLIGYWPFCGNTKDYSGNGLHAANYGANLTNDRFGESSNAYYFDGADYMETPNTGVTANNARTTSFWIKSETSNRSTVIGWGNGPSSGSTWEVGINWTACKGAYVDIRDNVYEGDIDIPSDWCHVVTRLSQGKNSIVDIEVFVNGKKDSKCFQFSTRNLTINTVQSKMVFGMLFNNTRYFKGVIDDIAIWDRALADSEISQLYNLGRLRISWEDSSFQKSRTIHTDSSQTIWVEVSDGIQSCRDSAKIIVPNDSFEFTVDTLYRTNCQIDTTNFRIDGKWKNVWWSDSINGSQRFFKTEGEYYAIVEDSFGCTYIDSLFYFNPEDLRIIGAHAEGVSCSDESDGSLHVEVSGGYSPYVFIIDDSVHHYTSLIDDLKKGVHKIVVIDSFGCTDTAYLEVPGPDSLTIEAHVLQMVSCYGGADGIVVAKASGGNPKYSYQWDDLNNTRDSVVTSLSAGIYSVIVRDSLGCSSELHVTLLDPEKISIDSIKVDSISCFNGSDGRAELLVSGGTGIYSFIWDSIDTTFISIKDNLSPGGYKVILKDENECKDSISFQIFQPEELTLSIVDIEDVRCYGERNGKVQVAALGGNGGYSYFIDSDTTDNADGSFNLLDTGMRYFFVVDRKKCVDSTSVYVKEPLPLSVLIGSLDSVSCFGESDGSAVVYAQGGNGDYSYSWHSPILQRDSFLSALPAGTYKAYAQDKLGCLDSVVVHIFEPDPLNIFLLQKNDVSCFGEDDGWVEMNAEGGNGKSYFGLTRLPTDSSRLVNNLKEV